MAFTKKFVFLAINFIFMTWIMFSTTDFALGSMGAKFKYVFILFCLLDIVTRALSGGVFLRCYGSDSL